MPPCIFSEKGLSLVWSIKREQHICNIQCKLLKSKMCIFAAAAFMAEDCNKSWIEFGLDVI